MSEPRRGAVAGHPGGRSATTTGPTVRAGGDVGRRRASHGHHDDLVGQVDDDGIGGDHVGRPRPHGEVPGRPATGGTPGQDVDVVADRQREPGDGQRDRDGACVGLEEGGDPLARTAAHPPGEQRLAGGEVDQGGVALGHPVERPSRCEGDGPGPHLHVAGGEHRPGGHLLDHHGHRHGPAVGRLGPGRPP